MQHKAMKRFNTKWGLIGFAAPFFLATIFFIAFGLISNDRLFASGLLLGLTPFVTLLLLFGFVSNKLQPKDAFLLSFVANRTFTCCLSEGGVSNDAVDMSSFYEWSSIIRQAATADHLMLFISPLEGILLPRRAFASATAFNDAIAFARARARPAHDLPPAGAA
jgi:hypothetical protein